MRPWLGDAGSMPQDPLPAGSVGMVIILGQSNPFGTSSWIADVVSRMFSDSPRGVRIWDQIKRDTRHTHTFVDTNDPTEANALSRFRPLTTGYGASGFNYMWQPGFTQVAQGDPIGPEMQLGMELRQFYRAPIEVVKCCQGGTHTAQQPTGTPDWNVASLDQKPESLLELLRDYYYGAALQALLDEGYERSQIYILGVISMVGAKDSDDQPNADAYDVNMGAIIDEVRSWIAPSSPTSVPWVIVQSEPYYNAAGGTTNNHTYITTVRNAQASLAATKGGVTLVSSDACERENGGNGEHIVGQGQVTLGAEMARGIMAGTPLAGPQGEVDPTAGPDPDPGDTPGNIDPGLL